MAARYGLPVILGFADEGVSDVNLAAAIAHDGSSPRVVLVCRNASGSLKSRAHQAGVSEVLDVALAVERFNVFVDAVKAWRDYLADFRPTEENQIDIRSMLSGFLV